MATRLNPLPRSLPVTCDVLPGESGMGFLLRSATANGLSLHALRDLAGISSVRSLWSADARGFAGLLGIPIPTLQTMLVERGQYQGHSAYFVRGQIFLHFDLLRLGKPQVCVYCVHRTGYCKAMWDCRLYTVCHVHKVPMSEVCTTCRQPLRWYRASIDVCQCGAYLKPTQEPAVEDGSSELLVALWIAKHFEVDLTRHDFSMELPHWMASLSLDGLCMLLRALGVHAGAHQRVVYAHLAKKSGAFWQGVCVRALQRLHAYGKRTDPIALAPFVWEGCLEGLALVSVTQADQQVALQLIQDIFKVVLTAKLGSHRSALCQMRLFED